MIDFVMTTPIDDVEVHHFPLELISEILQQVNQISAIRFMILFFSSNNSISLDTCMKMSLLLLHLSWKKIIHRLKYVISSVE